jgi:hypothetical protein
VLVSHVTYLLIRLVRCDSVHIFITYIRLDMLGSFLWIRKHSHDRAIPRNQKDVDCKRDSEILEFFILQQ